MMITIHGLPITAKYHDLKILIKQQCNISDFILDSLVSEVDGTKKVRVGLADDSEGSRLLKCLDGFRFGGNILRLVPVGKGSSTTQQPNSFDARGTYQQSDYSNQNLNDRNKSLDAARQTNWAHNQWSTSQPQLPVQNSYGYQQPAATPYGQATNTVIKPHFEPRDVTPTGRGPPQSQNYGYNPKSNLISLGPQNNMPSTLREIPQATSRAASGRYSNQNYDIPTEKPITIMKENFQGPNQYNLTSSHNQSSHIPQGQISPWATQQAQHKPSFEKPLQMFDKKPYDDRKYPSQAKYMQDASKPDDSYKYDKGGQSYSPQRKDFRDISRDEERGRVLKGPQYSDRRTPERRMSPSNRNMPSSGRHFSSGRQMSPSGRHASPPGRHIPSTGRHASPPNRHEQQSGRHSSPARHSFQSGRHTSPGRHGPQSGRMPSPGRQMLPAGRVSPQSGRHVSGGRYGSPPGRQVLTGRHISPTGRHVPSTDQHGSLSGRRMSPSESHMQMKGRQMSPNRQMPTERKVSPSRKMYPPRRDSPQLRKEEYVRERIISPPSRSPMDRRPLRQSPERDGGRTRHDSPRRQSRFSSPSRMEQKQVQYQDDHRNPGIKDIRPAYEPVQAPNEAMYSGGYRPNVREEAIKYQSRSEHWKDRENFSSKAIIDDRRESSRMQKFDIPRVSDRPRSDEQEVNRSRSPKRDRSPLRDRFKRHSPSPRSPRRSWALEKRRSPEIREPPPPPVWPQEKEEYQPQQVRPKFSENEMEKNSPVWETREKVRDTFQSSDDRRNFSDQRRPDVGKWKPIPGSSPQPSSSSRFDEPKPIRKEFVTRQEFIRDNVNLKVHPDTHEKEYRQDRSDMRYKSDFDTKHEIPRKRDEFSGRIEEKKKQILEKQEQLQKEIDQAYKRAVDFTKKAEMYIKGELKKESNYDDNRRRSRSEDRANPKEMQRFKRDPYEEDRDREKFRKDYRKPQYNRDDDRKNVHEDLNKPRNVYDPSLKHRMLPKAIRVKRMNVADDISDMIMSKHGKFLSGEMKKRVLDELKCTVTRKLHDMFDFDDVSEADMTAKFRTKYSSKDIEDIFKDVMFSLPNHYRTMKRQAQDDSDVPAKSFRRSSEASSSKDTQSKVKNEQKKKTDRREAVKKPAAGNGQKNREKKKSSDTKTNKDKTKDVKDTQQTDPAEEGEEQLLLDDGMTRILEEELNTIMIEVWQALPDDPPTEAEKFVAEKLRYEASDDLKNVLGLNVTKRLLNVHNPLIVKLQITGRPKTGSLQQFVKSYNVKSLRRVGTDSNVYLARLHSISDFDKICKHKDLRCGNAKVVATPIYKFSKCPPKLNSIYSSNEEEESKVENKEDIDGEDKDAETGDSKNITEDTNLQNKDLDEKVIENKDAKPNAKPSKIEDTKISNQTVTKVEQNNKNKSVMTTEKEKTIDNKAETKGGPDNQPKDDIKKVTQTKNNVTEQPVNDIKESDKINKNITQNEKPKVISINKVTIEEERDFLDEEVMEDEIQEFGDGDEMDDEEILALISEGVVVDECSGSEEE